MRNWYRHVAASRRQEERASLCSGWCDGGGEHAQGVRKTDSIEEHFRSAKHE